MIIEAKNLEFIGLQVIGFIDFWYICDASLPALNRSDY